MANVVVKKNSFGSRLLNSIGGVFLGIGIAILFLCMLAWNEGNNVKSIRAYNEAGKIIIETGSAKADPANNGMLVAVKGDLSFSPVTDPLYGVKGTFVLSRNVEMYQWKQTKKGSSTDKEVTYTYTQDWSKSAVHSSAFYDKTGHENPDWPEGDAYKSEVVYATDAKLGDFALTDEQLKQLYSDSEIIVPAPDKGVPSGTIPAGMNKSGDFLTNSSGSPKTGDIRIYWQAGGAAYASALGKQSGGVITAYTTKNNKAIMRFINGSKTGAEMIEDLKFENTLNTWLLRIIFTIIICAGFSMVFTPVEVLTSVIPFLGNFISRFTKGFGKAVGFIVGIPLSLVVIAVSWIVVRPLFAIPLLIIAGGIVYLVVKRSKEKAASSAMTAKNAAHSSIGSDTVRED